MSLRLATITEAEASKRWRDLAVRARIEARSPGAIDAPLLAQAVIRVRRAAFPIGGSAPHRCAAALSELALAYIESSLPARITIISRMLEAAAMGVDELLDEPALAAAAETRRRMGEREDA